jgi:hypothetical protein
MRCKRRQATPIALAPEGTRNRGWVTEHACLVTIINKYNLIINQSYKVTLITVGGGE